MQKELIMISEPSAQAHRVDAYANGHKISSSTGFAVNLNSRTFLVTNWHVLSGRSPRNGQPIDKMGATPDAIKIYSIGNPADTIESLETKLLAPDGTPRWIQHKSGQKIDVAAVEVPSFYNLASWAIDLGSAHADILTEVGMTVFIIGFPFGAASHSDIVPIWKTGHIASEPNLPYNGQPAILIDATTRSGMSGSPVIVKPSGPYRSTGSVVTVSADPPVLFLGIYSGRIITPDGLDSSLSSELGIVWKPEVISDILREEILGNWVIA